MIVTVFWCDNIHVASYANHRSPISERYGRINFRVLGPQVSILERSDCEYYQRICTVYNQGQLLLQAVGQAGTIDEKERSRRSEVV